MDRRAFLRRIVPAATGIVVAPAIALELLEAERRRRYWPGWSPGRVEDELERQFRDIRRRLQLEIDRQIYGESPVGAISRLLREEFVTEAMVASVNRETALLGHWPVNARYTEGRRLYFSVKIVRA